MFSFFKKKDKEAKVTDVVFASREAKWKALAEMGRQDGSFIFIAWFEESREQLQQYFDLRSVPNQVLTYREVHHAAGSKAVFIEHYPLAKKEKDLFASLQLPSVIIYSSLDEALFTFFGGDRISSMLSKMGLDEHEPVSHNMITGAIYNAQEKLASKTMIEQSARSMEEWMQKNVRMNVS